MEDGAQEGRRPAPRKDVGSGWGGWGGWGSSAFSVFSDLQKAAADVAEEISKTAVAAAKGAAKGVAELQTSVTESLEPELQSGEEVSEEVKEVELSPEDELRRAALEKLEGASKDSLFGQGLKVLDDSVETIATGALHALGNAWKGSVTLVQKLEHSAEHFAGTIQQGGLTAKAGSLAPSLIESSKALTARGIKVLEYVGRETMDILASETGLEIEKDPQLFQQEPGGDGESFTEEVNFDQCFYIYGGPEHVEELEALSSHYALLCSRARAKLVGESKSNFDITSKQLQEILMLNGEHDLGAEKGKKVEIVFSKSELKSLRESSISKAAEMAAGFTAALGGLALKEVVHKTSDRVEAIKTEGVHRLSELCAVCISHLLVLAKSVLEAGTPEGDVTNNGDEFDWPSDCLGKASVIKAQAKAMAEDIGAVSDSFMTGIGDVTAAFQTAIKSGMLASEESGVDIREKLLTESSIEDRAKAVKSDLENDQIVAIEKIQDGLEHLTFIVLSTTLSLIH